MATNYSFDKIISPGNVFDLCQNKPSVNFILLDMELHISPSRRKFELITILITGIVKFIFMDWLAEFKLQMQLFD